MYTNHSMMHVNTLVGILNLMVLDSQRNNHRGSIPRKEKLGQPMGPLQ